MPLYTDDGVEVHHTERGAQFVDADEMLQTDEMQQMLNDLRSPSPRKHPPSSEEHHGEDSRNGNSQQHTEDSLNGKRESRPDENGHL